MDVGPLALFHPVVARWFAERFGEPTEPQTLGWPLVAARRHTLIAAPTGSGKTLAAFLSCIDRLLRDGLDGRLGDETRVLYVSPLKALSNDVEKNLRGPLAELVDRFRAEGLELPELRVAVRTGDTLPRDRERIVARPPHLLVTTPESLFLMLTSTRGRKVLSTVDTVIVDEIHAVARDKRGSHLALSLERLDRLVEKPVARVGLSATQRPIEVIGQFLTGGRPCAIVDAGHRRRLDVEIELTDDELYAVASGEQWGRVYDRVAELVRDHRTTLVFVDTRRMAERATKALAERLGEDKVATHHGSMSRERRLRTEQRLKAGDLPVVVATASLELGIDVGTVDLVVLVAPPRAFSVGLQRIGRAGHFKGAIPKARIFPTTRDGLVETAAFLRGLRAGRLELTRIPENALDVLAQQLVAAAACEELGEDEGFDLVTRAWPYRDLDRGDYDAVVAMLSEGIATRRGRQSAWLHRDGVNHRIKGRRGARLAALTSGGAIPETAQYAVVADPEDLQVGTLDEDFAIESMPGDVFVLGNTAWRIRRVESGRVRVEDARGQSPTIPFWNGEAPGRSAELSEEVARLRADLDLVLDDRAAAERFAVDHCGLPVHGAKLLVDYLGASRAALGTLPTQDCIVAERFFDDAGGMQLVLHAPFGSKLTRALGLAMRKRFCRSFDFELQAAANDDGILLSLGPQHSFPLEDIFDLVPPHTAREALEQAALQGPMWGTRWRWNATRALAVLRSNGGRKTPPPILRMKSDDLLAAVFPAQTACQDNAPGGPIEIPDHPLCKQTIDDCLHEALDLDGLVAVLERIARREVRLVARDLPEPSPLSHEIVNGKPYTFLDDAPLEERRSRAVQLRRTLPASERELGILDPDAIAAVRAQVWPEPRDADEAHDALLGLGVLPEPGDWLPWLEALATRGRATRLSNGIWAATERLATALAAFPGSTAAIEPVGAAADDPAVAIVRGWLEVTGPITPAELAARTHLSEASVDAALLWLEMEGFAVRGAFSGPGEWCERRLLARIHRLTLGTLRKAVSPASAADFVRFLARWQRVLPGTRRSGPDGVLDAIGQLQGLQIAASAWEGDVLPARVDGYEPAWLDELCQAGLVAWGRLVAPPVDDEARRRAPTRSAPIAVVRREDLPWLLEPSTEAVSPAAQQVLDVLDRKGASFFPELAQALRWGHADLEEALWQLVAAGRVTCDAFAGLRALVDGARRRPTGRWTLFRAEPAENRVDAFATQLLRRWGVVLRDVLAREAQAPPWRELLPVFRRLEARGDVRGGRFVAGFSGEQFALPEAVDLLREVRRRDGPEPLDVAAVDPLNLVGILTPGARVPAVPGQRVRYERGVPEPLAAK